MTLGVGNTGGTNPAVVTVAVLNLDVSHRLAIFINLRFTNRVPLRQ